MIGYVKRVGKVPVITDVTEKISADMEVFEFGDNVILSDAKATDKNFEAISRSTGVCTEFFGTVIFVGKGEGSYIDYVGTLPSFVSHLYID